MKDHFKDFIKSHIDESSIHVNPKEIWAGVEHKLDKKRKRRFLFWMFPVVGVMMILAGLLIPKNVTNEKSKIENVNDKVVELKSALNYTLNEESQVTAKQEEIKNNENIESGTPLKKNNANNKFPVLEIHHNTTPLKTKVISLEEAVINANKIDYSSTRNEYGAENELTFNSISVLESRDEISLSFLDKLNSPTINYYRNFQFNSKYILDNRTNSKGQIFMEAFAGAFLINKSLSAKEPEFNGYVEDKKIHEKSLEAISTGFLIGVKLSKNASLKTGINYQRINEKFEFHGSYNVLIEREIVDTIFVFGPGLDDVFKSYKTEMAQNLEMRDIVHYNKYELINIPLLLEYNFHMPKWSFGIEAGLAYNVKFKVSGMELGQDGIPRNLTSDQFKSKTSLQWIGGINFRYKASDKVNFTLSPSLNILSNSITSQSSGHNQNFSLYGVNASVRYFLK